MKMKNKLDSILHLEQALYLQAQLPPRGPVFQDMESYATQDKIPISDPETVLFLEITTKSIQAKRVLEIGTAIGYGSIALASAMTPYGQVITIDPDPTHLPQARTFMQQAGVSDQIEILNAFALQVIPKLEGLFDLVYIDALKTEYTAYLDLILPKVRIGGVILADNVLWKGQVATGKLLSPDQKSSTEALSHFNRYFTTHPQLKATILPIGDGLAYGIKQQTP